jgi:hypothetical protein
VVLKGDQRERKSRVTAEPELKWDIEGGLRKSVSGSANLRRSSGSSTRSVDVGEGRFGDVGELGGVSNHLVVTTLLFGRKGHLVPDVHPVTILAVNSLTSNLDLDLGDELLSNIIQPAGIDVSSHLLVNLRESNLKVGPVSKVSVSGDSACNTATEVGLTRESLFDRFHGEIGMASVRHLPESDFRSSGKENVLGSVGDKLH